MEKVVIGTSPESPDLTVVSVFRPGKKTLQYFGFQKSSGEYQLTAPRQYHAKGCLVPQRDGSARLLYSNAKDGEYGTSVLEPVPPFVKKCTAP